MSTDLSQKRGGVIRLLIRGLVGFNLVVLVAMAVFALTTTSSAALAPVAQEAAAATGLDGTVALAAALSTGVACLGAGLAVGMTGSAALGTIAERPESFGRALIFVGLAEGIAIYGLIVSFLILTQ